MRLAVVFVAFVVVAIVAVWQASVWRQRPRSIPTQCAGDAGSQTFFPAGVLAPASSKIDGELRSYYAGFLSAMQEPSLNCRRNRSQSIRLLRLEYTGVPVAVRVEHDGNAITAHVVKLEAPTCQLPPGTIVRRDSARVTASAWQEILEAVKSSDYWSLPTQEFRSLDGPGTAWIVEAKFGDSYHVVNRASPDRGPYKDLGITLLAAAGVTEAELVGGAPGVKPRPFTAQPGMPPPPPFHPRPQ